MSWQLEGLMVLIPTNRIYARGSTYRDAPFWLQLLKFRESNSVFSVSDILYEVLSNWAIEEQIEQIEQILDMLMFAINFQIHIPFYLDMFWIIITIAYWIFSFISSLKVLPVFLGRSERIPHDFFLTLLYLKYVF